MKATELAALAAAAREARGWTWGPGGVGVMPAGQVDWRILVPTSSVASFVGRANPDAVLELHGALDGIRAVLAADARENVSPADSLTAVWQILIEVGLDPDADV